MEAVQPVPSETSRGLIARLFAAFNAQDLDQLVTLLAPNFIDHTAGPEQAPGIEGIKQTWAQLHAEFPGIRLVVDETIVEGDKVAVRASVHVPPSAEDRRVPRMLMEFARIADGRVAEVWNIVG